MEDGVDVRVPRDDVVVDRRRVEDRRVVERGKDRERVAQKRRGQRIEVVLDRTIGRGHCWMLIRRRPSPPRPARADQDAAAS